MIMISNKVIEHMSKLIWDLKKVYTKDRVFNVKRFKKSFGNQKTKKRRYS